MKTLLRTLLLAAALAPLAAQPARAQSPTPEGTTITNTATASWTDANSNTYTPVSASVSVVVGFQAGVDVVSAASVTPAAPSTGNELPFTINNTGNGTDSVTVSTTAGTGITITGYRVGTTTYATLAELNTALASTALSAGGSVSVVVVYTVASGLGGQTTSLALTANSRRTPTTTDTSTTSVQPPVTSGVSVTPDGATASRLPSNGTQYTATFTVTNNGNATGTFSLSASTSDGTVLSLVSVNGTAGSTATLAGLAAGASQTVDVVYTIANGAVAGATATLQLSASDGTASDAGDVAVTVIRPALTITKEAFRDDQTTAITGTSRVVPGEYIQYRITVTNGGSASASTVSVSDPLPAQVEYVSSGGDAAGWTITESTGTVTAALASLAGGGASRFFWIRVRVR